MRPRPEEGFPSHCRTAARLIALVAAVLTGLAARAAAIPSGSPAAAEALAVCKRAADLSGSARSEMVERGLALAEAAVEADRRDALAHYAVVCNLGKKMEDGGVGIGQLVGVYRLRRALDATLALTPNDADTLTAKGALLVRLPRLLGGDPAAAEVLLQRALIAEPENGTAKCYLAAAQRARSDGGATDPNC